MRHSRGIRPELNFCSFRPVSTVTNASADNIMAVVGQQKYDDGLRMEIKNFSETRPVNVRVCVSFPRDVEMLSQFQSCSILI